MFEKKILENGNILTHEAKVMFGSCEKYEEYVGLCQGHGLDLYHTDSLSGEELPQSAKHQQTVL